MVRPPHSIYGVYTRVCGGTYQLHLLFSCLRGLSPRVRGNLAAGQGVYATARSIPACAGEPKVYT